jgi:uncharacterized membrane protein YesL
MAAVSEQPMSDPQRRTAAELVDKVTSFILVNILWMIFAMLLVTLPMATAGLFATLTPWVRGQPSEPFRDFFGAMRRYAVPSTLIVLGDAALGLLVWANLHIIGQMDGLTVPALASFNVTLFVALAAIATNLYLWPLLVTAEAPLPQLVRLAAALALHHPGWSFLSVMLTLAPLSALVLLPGFLILFGLFSLCALLASWCAWRVIRTLERTPIP